MNRCLQMDNGKGGTGKIGIAVLELSYKESTSDLGNSISASAKEKNEFATLSTFLQTRLLCIWHNTTLAGSCSLATSASVPATRDLLFIQTLRLHLLARNTKIQLCPLTKHIAQDTRFTQINLTQLWVSQFLHGYLWYPLPPTVVPPASTALLLLLSDFPTARAAAGAAAEEV